MTRVPPEAASGQREQASCRHHPEDQSGSSPITTRRQGMSATEAHTAGGDPSVGKVDLKLEVHIIPVSDVDRAKQFYERVGFRIDADDAPMDGLRIVQTTPPGSGTSVTFGLGITT